MQLLKILPFIVAFVSSASAFASGNTTPYLNEASKPSELMRFIEQLETLRQEMKIPGLSVAVLKNQRLLLATGLGYASLERKIPASAQTPYDIASVAKPLSATLALRLVEQGKLDLDKTMSEYSDWQGFCEAFSKQPGIFAEGLRCEPATHSLRNLLSHTAKGQPGSGFFYNPPLYSWASRPIMSATGRSFSELVKEQVFVSAGMRDSARKYRDLPLPEDLQARLATPYLVDEFGKFHPSLPGRPQGDGAAGGVVSTVMDLARFDIALDRGELISSSAVAEMMTPFQAPDGQRFDYGLGWFIQEYQGHKLVWHSGWWEDAWSALYLKVPEENLSLILLANSEGIWWDNPLDKASVEKSPFVQVFFKAFLLD